MPSPTITRPERPSEAAPEASLASPTSLNSICPACATASIHPVRPTCWATVCGVARVWLSAFPDARFLQAIAARFDRMPAASDDRRSSPPLAPGA